MTSPSITPPVGAKNCIARGRKVHTLIMHILLRRERLLYREVGYKPPCLLLAVSALMLKRYAAILLRLAESG